MFRRKQPQSQAGDNPYEGLRAQAIGAVQAGLLAPSRHPKAQGVVINIPSDGEWIAIVALGDDTTSMYTSVGGGTIGAGEHEIVRDANRQLLGVIEHEVLPYLDASPGTHPAPGFVRYHVLGVDGLAGIDIPEPMFWGSVEGGGNLVDATQYLIHTISTVSPG